MPRMAGLTAGVDLGGTKIQAVVLRNRATVGSSRVPTPQGGADDVIAAIVQAVRDSLSQAGAAAKDLRGVGIGTPGEIDADRGEVSLASNVPGFVDPPVPLGPQVSRKLGRAPVHIDNDVRVAILGEFKRGAGRPYRNFLGVFVGTGVGGGLILDGKLREGRGAAGEIGHAVVKDGGRECSCGRHGCLEAYAGRGRMEVRARELVRKGRKTDLFRIMEKKGRTRLASGVWEEALEKKDKMAEELVDEADRGRPRRSPGNVLRRPGREGHGAAPVRAGAPTDDPDHGAGRLLGRRGRGGAGRRLSGSAGRRLAGFRATGP